MDNTPNQPSKFRTKNWVEINDDSRRTYNPNSQTKLKITMLKSISCDCSDTYILDKGTITVFVTVIQSFGTAAADAYPNNRNKEVIFVNSARFNDCISEINNTQINNAKDIDVVMTICKST